MQPWHEGHWVCARRPDCIWQDQHSIMGSCPIVKIGFLCLAVSSTCERGQCGNLSTPAWQNRVEGIPGNYNWRQLCDMCVQYWPLKRDNSSFVSKSLFVFGNSRNVRSPCTCELPPSRDPQDPRALLVFIAVIQTCLYLDHRVMETNYWGGEKTSSGLTPEAQAWNQNLVSGSRFYSIRNQSSLKPLLRLETKGPDRQDSFLHRGVWYSKQLCDIYLPNCTSKPLLRRSHSAWGFSNNTSLRVDLLWS